MRTVGIALLLLSFVGISSAQAGGQMGIEWKRAENIPLPRGGYFAAWHNDGLWLAGGSYWKDGKKLWTAEASFYDPRIGKWSTLKPIPKAFGYGATAAIDEDIYLLGGADGDGNPNREIYRLRKGDWARVGESPVAFIYPAYTAVGTKIYVFGGSSSATDVTRAANHAWLYDAASNKWESLPPIPGDPRQIFSAAGVGKDIFVFGGITQHAGEQPSNLNDAYRFNTGTRKWSAVRNMPIAMRAFWAGSDGKHVYLIGGYADSGLDTVYQYSPKKDEYELISKLPQPLMDTKFIFHKDIFYGASGEDKLVSRFPGLVIGRIR
jgi:N-acetylneuraminic acid mutarotase